MLLKTYSKTIIIPRFLQQKRLHPRKEGSELQHSDSAKRRRLEACHKPGKVNKKLLIT
jgi:hypothetical protein